MCCRLLSTLLLLLAVSVPAIAGPKCVCRANGKNFEEGQVTCFRLPSGMKLARCERVLNNTSWKMIGDGCPSAATRQATQDLALLCRPEVESHSLPVNSS